MKLFSLIGLVLCSTLAFGEGGSAAMESIDPIAPLSGPGCIDACEATLAACKQQCAETTARADDEHFDEGDVSVGSCLDACEQDASICRQDC
ncbi:hypothetical protein [Thiocystis violacea]|uniref:hypothetical protein n=1 Tax=Thiocystis violacea TaxID=13725 RepID=UPI001907B21C|nr:hypothetical protein [Thiocystis violacea]